MRIANVFGAFYPGIDALPFAERVAAEPFEDRVQRTQAGG